ncbi:MAG: biliverdin-producing heme oxygenase, partial [Caulobacterales bacterium]
MTSRFVLRNATHAAHARLDAKVEKAGIDAVEGYRAFLLASASALRRVEAALEASGVGAVLTDWPERKRSPVIAADLAGLGLETPTPEGPAKLFSRAEMFGALYVLEGSRLGARVLLKRARDAENDLITNNTRYLSHGEGSRLWPTFVDLLENEQAI